MVLLALAVAPSLAIAGFVYHKDTFQKEPWIALVISFLLGIVSVVPAIALEIGWTQLGFGVGTLPQTFFYAFVVVGLSEELAKYMMLRLYVYKKSFFDEPFDGIVYSVMISMGFAAMENVMYVWQGGLEVAILRMFTAVPAHAMFGVMMGYFIGFSHEKDKGYRYHVAGVLLATFFHGAYDFFLFQDIIGGQFAGAIISLLVGIYLAFRAITSHQKRSPFKRGN